MTLREASGSPRASRGAIFSLREHGIDAILLDIEGTTTPIAFVYEQLFPFARAHLREYLQKHFDTPEVQDAVRQLRAEWIEEQAPDVPAEAGTHSGLSPAEAGTLNPVGSGFSRNDTGFSRNDPGLSRNDPGFSRNDTGFGRNDIASYVEWLMDRDRKSPGLKALQGHIWEDGYREGALTGDVFPDVPTAFRRWRDAGVRVSIYSSGSVLAQRLLFSSTPYGDLTPHIDRFFDTSVGAKVSADSYRRIAEALGLPASRQLFVSDVVAELDAARGAGYRVLLSVRPGNRPQQIAIPVDVVERFDEIG